MPATRHTPPTRSGYSDPRTPHGVSLTETSRAAGGFFLLHEVGWLPRGLHWHFPRVLSPFWRLYHNPKPGWHLVHRDRLWPLDPAHILLVPDGTVFDCHGAAGIPHFWVHFTLASPLRTPPIEPVTLALTPPLRALIRHLLSLLRSPTPATILHHSASALLHQSLASLDPDTLRSHPEKLAALLNHIARHPAADHSNSALARHAGLS
jgi:AraC family transcriptional regulator, arabinose operon regulatory protein